MFRLRELERKNFGTVNQWRNDPVLHIMTGDHENRWKGGI